MKILHLFKDYYPPVRGGIEFTMSRMAREAVRAGAEVTVLTSAHGLRRDSEERIEGVRVIRCAEWMRAASTPICPGMPLRLAGLHPDILHLHFPSPPGEISCLLNGRRRGILVTYHCDVVRQASIMKFYRPFAEAILDRAATIMPTSPEYLESSPYLNVRRNRCEVVPLGIELEPFAHLDRFAAAVPDLRARYGGGFALFVGRYRYYKGLETLLRAMPRASLPLVLIGGGPEEAGLRQLASELGVADRVHFLRDLDEEALHLHLAAAEMLVLPSVERNEAFGLALVEGLASGLPCISTALGTGTSFVNADGETGIVVPPRDPERLADALMRLHGDAALRARYGAAGRERAHRMFSTRAMMERLIPIYERTAGTRLAASGPGC